MRGGRLHFCRFSDSFDNFDIDNAKHVRKRLLDAYVIRQTGCGEVDFRGSALAVNTYRKQM